MINHNKNSQDKHNDKIKTQKTTPPKEEQPIYKNIKNDHKKADKDADNDNAGRPNSPFS